MSHDQSGLSDLQAGSDAGGLVTGLVGLQQQQPGNGLQSQGGINASIGYGSMGGMAPGMVGDLDGQHGTSQLLAQQQALMAMATGSGNGSGENGSNKDALMNLLAKQGFGTQMGSMNLGQAPSGMGNVMGGVGGINFQNNPLGGIGSMGGFGRPSNGIGADNSISGVPLDNSVGLLANPVLNGFPPGLQGGLQGGLPIGMAGLGMAGLGGSGLMGHGIGGNTPGAQIASINALSGLGGNDKDGDSSRSITADATTSSTSNPMLQQNLLMQQLLAQQQATLGGVTGSLWQQYGNLTGAEGFLGGAGTNNNLNIIGQGAANNNITTTAPPPATSQREPGESGVFQSGAIPEFTKSGKKTRPKKPKNKPKRPLSAYNIFFRDERANILAGIPDKDEDDNDNDDNEDDDNNEDGDAVDGSKKKTSGKKRKRPPHGKIGFESLAKIVGQRWKELKPEELAKYKKLADVDMVRYRSEMESYVAKQREGLEQSRDHIDNLVEDDNSKRHFYGDN